jgi:hypothetical protein
MGGAGRKRIRSSSSVEFRRRSYKIGVFLRAKKGSSIIG